MRIRASGLSATLMMFAPVPGHGAGHLDVERNFSHYIDRIVLGAHNYEHTKTWDPEGVISTLPSIASALLGVLAGQILALAGVPLTDRVKKLALIGAVLIPAALVWHQWLPINKSIWTSSFAVFMAGLDFVLFAICLWAVDVRGMRGWTRPFVIMGMNAIAVYMSSELIDIALWNTHAASGQPTRVWLYDTFFRSLPFAPVNNSLLYAVAYTLFNFGIAYGMYRRRWFLRV